MVCAAHHVAVAAEVAASKPGCPKCFGYCENARVLCCLLQVWAGCKRGGVVYVWGVPVPARFSWVPALALVRRHESSRHSLS